MARLDLRTMCMEKQLRIMNLVDDSAKLGFLGTINDQRDFELAEWAWTSYPEVEPVFAGPVLPCDNTHYLRHSFVSGFWLEELHEMRILQLVNFGLDVQIAWFQWAPQNLRGLFQPHAELQQLRNSCVCVSRKAMERTSSIAHLEGAAGSYMKMSKPALSVLRIARSRGPFASMPSDSLYSIIEYIGGGESKWARYPELLHYVNEPALPYHEHHHLEVSFTEDVFPRPVAHWEEYWRLRYTLWGLIEQQKAFKKVEREAFILRRDQRLAFCKLLEALGMTMNPDLELPWHMMPSLSYWRTGALNVAP
jgi:hypothetical protein